jgi:PAS domain-containing protein
MIQELDQLNRKLEGLVEERTAELREREAQLQAQNLRFDAALNNMSQAVVMFDVEQRLVICNSRYLCMYGLSADIVKPGCTVRELLEHRGAVGSFSGDVETYVKDLLDTLATGGPSDGAPSSRSRTWRAMTRSPTCPIGCCSATA